MSNRQTISFDTPEEKVVFEILEKLGYSPITYCIVPITTDDDTLTICPDLLINDGSESIIIEITTSLKRNYARSYPKRSKTKKSKRLRTLQNQGRKVVILDIRALIKIFQFWNIPFTKKIKEQITKFPNLLNTLNLIQDDLSFVLFNRQK